MPMTAVRRSRATVAASPGEASPASMQRCTAADGKDWPCGMAARTAQRLFLRNRTIGCDLPSREWSGTATAECLLGEQNIAEWLVSNGWAAAEPGSALVAAGEDAKANHLGLFGEDPRVKVRIGDAPSTLPVTESIPAIEPLQ